MVGHLEVLSIAEVTFDELILLSGGGLLVVVVEAELVVLSLLLALLVDISQCQRWDNGKNIRIGQVSGIYTR